MSFKLYTFVVLACTAAVHGAKLSNVDNTDIIPMQREGRIIPLEAPTMVDLIYTGFNVTWFLLSTAWSVVGYKLAAVALIANVAIWVAQNCFSAIVGAAVTLAFCKLSGQCTLDYSQEYEEVPEELSYAAKHLENGEAQYSS